VIIEGDIALNPAFSFTLDDEWVHDGSTARSFRQVLMHELGHMWGLDHQTGALSIMNDSQSNFRFFGFPYMDDAERSGRVIPHGRWLARTSRSICAAQTARRASLTRRFPPLSQRAAT
jgi:hypothetical protein